MKFYIFENFIDFDQEKKYGKKEFQFEAEIVKRLRSDTESENSYKFRVKTKLKPSCDPSSRLELDLEKQFQNSSDSSNGSNSKDPLCLSVWQQFSPLQQYRNLNFWNENPRIADIIDIWFEQLRTALDISEVAQKF